MKIAIGLPHLNSKNDDLFQDSLTGLIVKSIQEGLEIEGDHIKSSMEINRIVTYRDNITFARNKIASKAIKEFNADYILFLDDDMVFEPDLLIKLLAHKKDIVGGLTFLRSPPHEPSMFTLNSDGHTFNPIYMWKPKELVECDAIGMAATLISRKVFEKMMSISQHYKNIWGFYDNLDFTGEDLRFCRKARDLGFKIYCDTSQLVGHITTQVVGYSDYKAMADDKVFNIKKHLADRSYKKA